MIEFPYSPDNYKEYYDLLRANIEYSLRQKLFKDINDKLIEDFKKEIEPLIQSMLEGVVIDKFMTERDVLRMKDDIGINVKIHIEKIENV